MRTGATLALLMACSAGSATATAQTVPPASAPAATVGAPDPPSPAVDLVPPVPPPRAPRNALWLGARLGMLAYGGGLYLENSSGDVESIGNFVTPGLAVELDVGARLAKRYIPFVALEFGVVGAGHRFDGTRSQAKTTFAGVGVRYVAGDVETLGLLAEISFGLRTFDVSRNGSTWSATGLEIFRLGLGAEVRIDRRLTLSPMITLSGGTLTDTRGNVTFASNQGDGQSGPLFSRGATIPDNAHASYYAVVLGCGGHVDLFGR